MPTGWCRRRAAAPRRSRNPPKPIKKQTVAEARGQTARFLSVYDEYKKAPEVTRQRMYLETMERLLGTNPTSFWTSAGPTAAAWCRSCRLTS